MLLTLRTLPISCRKVPAAISNLQFSPLQPHLTYRFLLKQIWFIIDRKRPIVKTKTVAEDHTLRQKRFWSAVFSIILNSGGLCKTQIPGAVISGSDMRRRQAKMEIKQRRCLYDKQRNHIRQKGRTAVFSLL